MKVIVIMDIDPDTVMNSFCGDDEKQLKETSLEYAIEGELGWVCQSGISVDTIIMPDDIEPNDTDFGSIIKKMIQ